MTEGENNTSGSGAGPVQAGAAAPWYRRPFLWGLLFFVLLFLLAAWLVWKEWQAAEQRRASLAAQTAESRKRNDALEAYLQKLHLLLEKDPCVIQRELGSLEAPPNPTLPALPAAPLPAPPGGPDASGQLPATPSPTSTRKPEAVAELLEQATVLILAQQAQGLSMGSGFFVAPGYIVTNGHVVGNATEAIVINKATHRALRAAVLRSTQSNGRDFAVLKVAGAPAITPLKLASAVKRTERVSAWGFPGAITADDPKFAALLQGNVKAVPEVVYTDGAVSVILQRKPPLIVHTATVSQGNSGGPLVNDAGEVVGINTFIKLDDESYRQSSLAIVSDSLADYLRSVQVPFSRAAAATARPGEGEKP